MKKRIVAIFLAIVLVVSSVPMNAYAKTKKLTVEQRAEQILKGMSMNEKLAQMLFVYLPAQDAGNIQKKYQFGGYVLFAQSFKNSSKKEKKEQLARYQRKSKINMLIAVDEEGGTVNRVSLYKQFRSTPFATDKSYYNSGGWKNMTDHIHSKDKMLSNLGINTNFAPVADVAYNSGNYIYSRSFSTDADLTSKYIEKAVKQMAKDNEISTLKHFPGYGNNGDTHSKIIRDNRSLKTFKSRDLKPFQAGIDAGCDMIMVSHNIVNAFDKKNPASLSKKVHKYIRKDMGFDGVVVSDGLGMAGVLDFVGGDKGEVVVRAILAGNDMVLTGAYADPYKALKKAVKDGRLTKKQVDTKVKRILILKLKRGIIK